MTVLNRTYAAGGNAPPDASPPAPLRRTLHVGRQHRRKLVEKRLPRAGRKQRQRPLPIEQRPHDHFPPFAKTCAAEVRAERAVQVHMLTLRRHRPAQVSPLRREDLQLGRGVGEVRRITRDDAPRALAPGESCVERIVNAASHHAPSLRFANRRFVIGQGQRLDAQAGFETQRQLCRRGDRHLVETGERGERLGQGMSVGEWLFRFLQRLQAGGVFGMPLQQSAHKNPCIKKSHRS